MELEAGRISAEEALEALQCGERHLRRLRARILERGPVALNHGNMGRTPWHALGADLRDRVIAMYREDRFWGMNFHQFTEMIGEHEGILISRPVVHRWLKGAGIAPPRPQRRRRHRKRRQRSASEGHMVQLDASEHRWVAHLPKFTIFAAVDDATGKLWVFVRPTEDLQGYMELLKKLCITAGIPRIAYTDGFSSFGKNRRCTPEQIRTEKAQLKRVLKQLGIQHITAGSAPAKGRVERVFNTLQDRLIAHLKFDHVQTMEDVLVSLANYVRSHNRRFAKPAHSEPVWREWPKHLSPDEVFCRLETRVVRKDNSIVFYGTVIDLPPAKDGSSRYRQRLDVLTDFKGSTTVKHGQDRLALVLTAKTAKFRPQANSTKITSADRIPELLADRI